MTAPRKSTRTRAGYPDVARWRAASEQPATLTESVLRLIWERKTISRAEIAELAGLSRSTVSEIVASLIATSLVSEKGVGASRGGRRPVVLAFEDAARVILGVDVGASHIGVVLTDLRGRILTSERREFAVQSDPQGALALVTRFCNTCLATWGGDRALLTGIGLALPSPVDPLHPDRVSPLALPAWHERHGFFALRQQFNVPVLVDNDANLGALAEHWWGAGRGFRDFTYIKVSTGIGSGQMIGGRVYRGSSGVAGEIGHIAIDPRGEMCGCGNRGCLQTFAGAKSIVARARHLRAQFPDSLLAEGELRIGDIADAALAHDPLALQVVRETADYLGIAIAGLLNLNNPAAVILGGSLARLGALLLTPLRETIQKRTFVSSVVAAEIRVGELGSLVIAIGAATMILDAALSDPTHLLFERAQ